MASFGESSSLVLASANSDIPSLGNSYGAYLIATFIGLILYGVGLHQTYRYARLFTSDSVFIRLLVYCVMILETVHTIMTMHSCYFYLVTNYSDSSTLKEGVWSLIYAPILIGLITFVSQLFFARRVFLIGPHYQVIVAIAIFFYVAEIAVSAAAIYVGVTIPSISELVKVTHYVSAAFATAVVGDLLLSYALALVLYRSRKGLKRPNTVMDLLGTYFINTGGIHLVFNILALVMSLVLPSDLIHTSINVVTTRVYAIILLTVLNSRQLMVSQGVEIIDGNFGMNIIARANRLAAQERWNVPQVPASDEPAMINIKVTTETDGDLSGKLPNDQVSGGKPFRDSI